MTQPNCKVTDVRFTAAGVADVASGLLGFVSCTYSETLVLDSIALRRTLSGRWTLAFPTRRDRAGQPHPYVRPRDNASRLAIEAEVFKALGLVEEAAS